MPDFKSVLKSIARGGKFVSMSLLEATIPATAETLKSSIEMSKDLKDFAVRGKTIIQSQISTMQNMKGNKDAVSIMTSAFDDLKKGLFSSDEYYNDWGDYEETPATHVDGEDEPGYGDITKLHEDNEEIKEAILGSSRNTIDAINYSTQLTAGSNLKGLQSIGTQLNTTMVFGINKINTEMIRSNTILSAINQNMVAMVEFNNRNVAASNQAMMTYFDKSLEALGKLVSASGANRKKQSSEWKTNLFSSAFNFGSYKDHVKDKLKKKSGRSALGGSMGAVGSAIELMQLQKEFDPDASIVKMLSGLVADLAVPTAINAVIPKNIKFGTNKLDDSIQNLMKESLKKLGDMKYDSSKNPTLQMLGSLFGMERSSRKIQILDISKYNKGATSWNGIAQKTLVEVIPNYLARIEAALSNKEERYFDHTKGRFSTASEITDIFEEEKAAITKNALRETSSSIDLFSMKQTLDPLVKRRLQTKISEAFKYRIENRGRGIDEDYRKKINDAFRGTHFTPRQKDDIIMQLENAIEYSFDEYESYFNRHAAMNEDGMAVVTNILNKERRHTTSNMSKKLQNVIQTENESLESKRTFSVKGMQSNLFDSSILLGAKTRSGFQITNRIIEGWIKDVKGDVIENLKTRLKDRFEEYDKDIYDFESLWIRDYDFLEGLTKLIKEMTTRDDDINIKKEISVYWSNKYIDRMSPWKRAYNKLIGGARHPLDDELTSESTILKRMGGAISGLSSKINKVSTGITYTKDGLSLEEMRKFQEEEKSTMNKAVSSETINLGGLSNSNISQTSPLQNTWIDIIANGIMAAYKTMGFDNIKSKKFEKKRRKGSFGPAQSRATESDEQGYTFKSVMGNKTSNIFEEMRIEDNDSEIDTTINFDAPIPESIMNATHQSIEQDTYRDAEDLERLFRKESKKSGEKSFLNVVKGSLVTMMNSFTNMTKSIFGKDGVAGKIFQNEHFQKFWKYLFDKDTGKFKGVINRINDAKLFTNKLFTGKGYTNSKGKEFEDTEDNVKENMKGVYDFLFKNTMKGTMGDDYEDHKMYQKYLSRLNIFQSEEGKEKDARIRGYHGKSIQSNLIYSRDDLNEDGTMKEDAVPVGMRNNDGSTTPFRKYHSGTVKVPGKPGEEKLAILQAGEKVLSTAQVKMQEAKENLGNKMADHISGVMDAFFGDKDPKEMISEISDKFRKALPKAVTGGILGTIVGGMTGGSLFGTMILGGLGGPILGAGIGFLSQSDKFKDMIFGKMNDGGKREGGLITQAFQEKFKKAIPTMVTGGVLGLLKSTIFGSFASATPLGIMSNIILGPLGGAALGIGFSLLKNSETFQNTLFGPPDENGQRKSTMLGNLTNTIKQNVINAAPMLKKGLSGAVMGGVGAGLLGSMGFLPSMFAIGGPIGGAIAGAAIGIGSTSKRFQEMMFGTEEVDSKGNPTGKRLKDGILSKMQAMLTINVMEPIKDKVSEGIQEFGFWMREDMMEPFIKAFGPIIDGFADMKDDVSDFLKDKMTSIAEGVTSAIKKTFETIFSPIGDMIKFATKSTLKLLGIGAKMTGAMLAAPIKMVSALMAPKRAGEYLDFYNQYGTGRKDITEEEQEEMRNQSFGKKLFGAAKGKVKSIFAKDDDFDQARDDYNDDMTKQKRNTLNWRNSGKRMKALREERKQAREDRRKWGKVDNIRKELAGDKKKGDAYNQEKVANWSDRHFAFVQKRLRRELGDDAKGIETREDIKNLIYNREQWKSDFGYSPIKAGSPQSLNEQMVTANELSQKQYEENKTWRESYFEKLGNVVESAFRKATGKEKDLSSEESNEINDIFNDLKTKDLVDKWKKNSSGTADMFDNSAEKLLVGILQGVTATTDAVELEGKRQQDRDEKDIATQKAIALGEKEGEEEAKARGLKGLWKKLSDPFGKRKNKEETNDESEKKPGVLDKIKSVVGGLFGGFGNILSFLGPAAKVALAGTIMGATYDNVLRPGLEWVNKKLFGEDAASDKNLFENLIGTGSKVLFGQKDENGVWQDGILMSGLKLTSEFLVNNGGQVIDLLVDTLKTLAPDIGRGLVSLGSTVLTSIWDLIKAPWEDKEDVVIESEEQKRAEQRKGNHVQTSNAGEMLMGGSNSINYNPETNKFEQKVTNDRGVRISTGMSLSAARGALDAGSKAGIKELSKSAINMMAKDSAGAANLGANIFKTGAKATKQVLTGHPIKALMTIIGGAFKILFKGIQGGAKLLLSALQKFGAKKETCDKIITKLSDFLTKNASEKIIEEAAKKAPEKIAEATVKAGAAAAKGGIETTVKASNPIGWAIAIGQTVGGAILGAFDAGNLFGIANKDADGWMKAVSVIFGAFFGAPWGWAFELLFMILEHFNIGGPGGIKRSLAELLYEIFAGEDSEQFKNYKIAKEDMSTARETYNQMYGTNLTEKAFNDLMNPTVISKGINAIKGIFGADTTAPKMEDLLSIAKSGNLVDPRGGTDNDGLPYHIEYTQTSTKYIGSDKRKLSDIIDTTGWSESEKNSLNQLKPGQTVNIRNQRFVYNKQDKSLSIETASTSPSSIAIGGGFNPRIAGSLEKKANEKSQIQTTGNESNYFNTIDEMVELGRGNQFQSQKNKNWNNMILGQDQYGNVATMGNSGCGPTTLSNLLNQMGANTDPTIIATMAKKHGMLTHGAANEELFTRGAEMMGLKSMELTPTQATKVAEKNESVIIAGKSNSKKSPYSIHGHIMKLDRVENNKAYVTDPETGEMKSYPLSEIIKGMTNAWKYEKNKINGNLSNNIENMAIGRGGEDYIGNYVKEFESGSRGPSTISSPANRSADAGGPSFGTFQFPSYWAEHTKSNNSLPIFWDKYGFSNKYNAIPGNNQAFKDAWTDAVNSDPEGFARKEREFGVEQYYKVASDQIWKKFGLNSDRSRAVQEAVWSTAIQYGMNQMEPWEHIAKDYDVNTISDENLIKRLAKWKEDRARLRGPISLLKRHQYPDGREPKKLLSIKNLPPIGHQYFRNKDGSISDERNNKDLQHVTIPFKNTSTTSLESMNNDNENESKSGGVFNSIKDIFGNLEKVFSNFFDSKISNKDYVSIFDNTEDPMKISTNDLISEGNLNADIGKPSTNKDGQVNMAQYYKEILYNQGAKGANTGGEFQVYGPRGTRSGFPGAHWGVDIGTSKQQGVQLPTATSGEVVKNEWNKYSGNKLWIKDPAGYTHSFSHLEQPSPLKVGTKVNRGDIVGIVGTTGDSSGEHLHYEIETPSNVPKETMLNPKNNLFETKNRLNPANFSYDPNILSKLTSEEKMGLVNGERFISQSSNSNDTQLNNVDDSKNGKMGDYGGNMEAITGLVKEMRLKEEQQTKELKIRRNENIKFRRPGDNRTQEIGTSEPTNTTHNNTTDVTNSISNDGLRDALKGAISTGGIEDKLDAIIGVMSSWFDFDKENSDKINMNLINNKNQTPVVVQSSNTQTKNIPDLKNKNLRQIHEFIARGRELSVK